MKNAYDTLLRRSNLSAANSQSSILNSSFLYDGASRLSTVTDGAYTITYSYLPNSYLVDTINFQKNGNTVMTTKKQYDGFNRLTSIQNVISSPSRNLSFSYQYNTANQRTRVDLADGSYWLYQYDSLGQVTSGKKYWLDNTPVTGQQFNYNFDSIGNRISAVSNGRTANYSPNNLNQYTQRDVPGAMDILGSATTDSIVTVNNQPTTRKNGSFYKELNVDNSASAVYQSVDIVGVKNNVGPNGEDAVMEEKGNIFLPQTPEAFIYDADGNLTSDGRWNYSWDAENRLIRMESISGLPAEARRRLEFTYDYQGRRIQKKVYTWDGSSYVLRTTLNCVYDGWNKIAELDASGNLIQSYMWGLDLSGSMQYAGGVGGLLEVNTNGGSHFVAMDGNGNVTALIDANTGTISAQYEYGPFGELIRATGPMAKINPMRFSTKYQDQETGLLYYGYRYYNPSTGRWPSRDPIGIKGGKNLYVFVSNNSINSIDLIGLGTWDFQITSGTSTFFPAPLIEVSYVMSDQEFKCCKKVQVKRYAKRFSSDYQPDDKTGLNNPGGVPTMGNTPANPATAEPDEPGYVFPPLIGYVFPLTIDFKWDALCISGPNEGKILSTRFRTLKVEGNNGHWAQ